MKNLEIYLFRIKLIKMSRYIRRLAYSCVDFYFDYYPPITIGAANGGYYSSRKNIFNLPYGVLEGAMIGSIAATVWPLCAGVTVYSILTFPPSLRDLRQLLFFKPRAMKSLAASCPPS
jgi:hypothetical protein